MDSKQKFIKNKYWKKKYQPRNGASNNVNKPSKNKPQDVNQPEEESEDDSTLKQPVPKDGWFPESDSEESSDLDDFTSLAKITGNKKQSDKNWFDKELDNVQVASEVPNSTKNVKEDINKYKSISNSKIRSNILKKVIKDEKSNDNADSEEKELDFLLSLKEPIYTGPVVLKRDIENDKRIAYPNTNHMEQKPIKSIDLEKWLDSVLDD